MQLSKQTDFAFRVLIYLGQLAPEQRATVNEICDYYGISANHVAKVVARLAASAWIESSRGKGGGIRLALAAEDINLAEVVALFETTLTPVNCDEPLCRINSSCQLKSVLAEAMQGFVAVLRDYSLADVLQRKGRPVLVPLQQL